LLSTETEDGVLRIGVSTSQRRDPIMTFPSNKILLCEYPALNSIPKIIQMQKEVC
jgi:hypothetical protein